MKYRVKEQEGNTQEEDSEWNKDKGRRSIEDPVSPGGCEGQRKNSSLLRED